MSVEAGEPLTGLPRMLRLIPPVPRGGVSLADERREEETLIRLGRGEAVDDGRELDSLPNLFIEAAADPLEVDSSGSTCVEIDKSDFLGLPGFLIILITDAVVEGVSGESSMEDLVLSALEFSTTVVGGASEVILSALREGVRDVAVPRVRAPRFFPSEGVDGVGDRISSSVELAVELWMGELQRRGIC